MKFQLKVHDKNGEEDNECKHSNTHLPGCATKFNLFVSVIACLYKH